MAGERAQATTARVLSNLSADAGLDGIAETLNSLDKDIHPTRRRRRGGGAEAATTPAAAAAAAAATLLSVGSASSTSASFPRSATTSARQGRSSRENSSTAPADVVAGVRIPGGAPASATSARPPQSGGRTVLLQGAQADAARKALALNAKLQAVIRNEMNEVEEILQKNKKVLAAAEARLTSKRCVAMSTSSDKFRWSRAVGKFLQVQAHPGKMGLHKEQEMLLRKDQIPWKSDEVKALSSCVAAQYPEAVKPGSAFEASRKIDWEQVSLSLANSRLRKNKRDRFHCPPTADECRLRWTHFTMPGASADAPWSKEEDLAIIMHAEERDGREWVKIAEEVTKVNGGVVHRSAVACLRRFQCTLNTKLVRWSRWTEEEDQMLISAVKRHGRKSWLTVARDCPGRSPVQCQGRFKVLGRGALPDHHHPASTSSNEERLLERGWGVDDDNGDDDDDDDHVSSLPDSKGPQQQQHHNHHPESESDRLGGGRMGLWTLNEERRLCLAMRALMPQKKKRVREEEMTAADEIGTRGRRGGTSGATATAPAAHGQAGPGGGGMGKGKKRRRESSEETRAVPDGTERGTVMPSEGSDGAPRLSGGREEEEEEGGGADGESPGANKLDYVMGVDWTEVSKLMLNMRSEKQCRLKWFEVLDPSVNHDRTWAPEEDAQLCKIMGGRKIGDWGEVEREMARWARANRILRRTHNACRKRYGALHPERYARHVRDERDRREVEPRLNVPTHASHRGGGKTEVTFEDFDLVEDNSGEAEDGEEDDDDDDDDDDF